MTGNITKASRCSDRGDTAAVERRRAGRGGDSLTVDHWGLAGPVRQGGAHYQPAHSNALRDRLIVVAVAAGAITSSGSALVTQHADASGEHIDLIAHQDPISPAAPGPSLSAPTQPEALAPQPGATEPILPLDDLATDGAGAMVASLMAGTALDEQRQIAAEGARLAEEQARRPRAAMPAVGSLTSGFGQRWGSLHGGADIANAMGVAA